MSKPVTSFRLDEKLVKKAKDQGINLAQLFEAAMIKAIKDNRCPTCGKKR